MNKLRTYLNSLPSDEKVAFATACGTTVGYLRKAISVGQQIGESLCINMERESRGFIRCEEIRPDVDWAYLRRSGKRQRKADSVSG